MKLNQLVIFTAAAKYQNLTRAAEVLRMSQPGVSKGLKALEAHLGTILYTRTGHGINLTDEGWRLLAHVEPILTNFDNLEKGFVPAVTREQQGSVAIGGSYGPAGFVLPSLLVKLRKKHPRVQHFLRTGNRASIERLVLKGDVEIALVTLPINSPSLVMEPYRREKLVAFVSVDHPLAKKKKVTLSDMLQTPLVIRGERGVNSRIKEVLNELKGQGYKPEIAACYELPDAVKAAVRQKMGVGFLYSDTIRADVPRGDFKVLKIEGLKLDSESFIIHHKDRQLSAHAQAVLTLLRERRQKRPT